MALPRSGSPRWADRPRGAEPVAVVHPGRAQRQPRLHLRSAADACRRADGDRQGRRRGDAGGGLRVRPAVRAQRDRRGQGRVGDLSAVKRVVKVVGFVASHARLHRPAAGRQRCLRAARRRCSATPACTPGRRSAWPPCRSDAPVEVELVVECEISMRAADPVAADKLVEMAREYDDGTRTPAEPRDAATVVLLRPSDEGPVVYLLRRQVSMEFAGGMCVFPGGGVDGRDFDASVAWAGPSPGRVGGAARRRRGTWRARWCVRRCGRRSRSRACCWPARRPRTSSPTPPATTGRPTGSRWSRASSAMTDFLTRRGLVLRTDLLGSWGGWLTPCSSRSATAPGSSSPRCPEGQRTRDVSSESRGGLAAGPEAVDRGRRGRVLMLPPTYLTCLEVGHVRHSGRGARCGRGRSVDMFTPRSSSRGGGLHAVDARPAAAAGRRAGRSMSEPWAGGAFGERGTCVLAPNAGIMTLDGTNTWVLREPGSSRSVVVDPGPSRTAHVDAVDERPGDVAVGAAHPPPLRPLRGGAGVRRPGGLRRTGARPGVPPRRRGPRRRRRRRGRRPASSGWWPRPATPPTRSPCWSRPSGPCSPVTRCWAAARPLWPTPTASSAPTSSPSTGCTPWPHAHGRDDLACPRPGASTTRSRALDYYIAHRHQRLDQVSSASRSSALPAPDPDDDCPERSSRSSTRTSTRSSGVPPSARSAPSWPTSPPVESPVPSRDSPVLAVELPVLSLEPAGNRPQRRFTG